MPVSVAAAHIGIGIPKPLNRMLTNKITIVITVETVSQPYRILNGSLISHLPCLDNSVMLRDLHKNLTMINMVNMTTEDSAI